MAEKKLNGTAIVTYRCNARCSMCSRYKAPSRPEEDITLDIIKKLPPMSFTNIAGGEPFIRTDLKDAVRELYEKSDINTNGYFTDPYGDAMPCNGTKDEEVMGSLNSQDWEELWNLAQAEKVRNVVRHCNRNCRRIGSASPAMYKYIWKPGFWVIKHKLKALVFKKRHEMSELKIVRDFNSGVVSKEELDGCSTCDKCTVADDGLWETSKADARVFEAHEVL